MPQKTTMLFLIFLVLCMTGFAQNQPQAQSNPVDVSGTWDMTVQAPNGEMKSEMSITQEKDVIKVKMVNPMGETKGEGTVKGNELQWTLTMSTPNGDITLVHKAKVEADKMTGEVQAGDFGAFPFTAQKKK